MQQYATIRSGKIKNVFFNNFIKKVCLSKKSMRDETPVKVYFRIKDTTNKIWRFVIPEKIKMTLNFKKITYAF